MVERWRAFGGLIDQLTANLRRGLRDGRVATHTPVARAIDALTSTLAAPDDESALLAPLRTAGGGDGRLPARAPPRGCRRPSGRPSREALTAAVRDRIRPALARHRTFLVEEILPRARPDDRPGIGHLPGGEAAYRTLVRRHTTLDLAPGGSSTRPASPRSSGSTPRWRPWAGGSSGVASRAEALDRLRGDPAMHFSTRAEVEATARAALDRANAAVPALVRPAAGRAVRRRPDAGPRGGALDDRVLPAAGRATARGRASTTSTRATRRSRPRYEAECLAFHESVPGHHLQIAIAQELTGLPDFRRHLGATAFWEGWGLYTERLSDEMGLYTRRPRPDRDALDGRLARLPARRRHGHARARLDAPGGHRLHGRQQRPRPEQHRQRGRPVHRLAGPGARLQGRPARDAAPARRGGGAARRPVRHPGVPRRAARPWGDLARPRCAGVIEAWVAATAP